MTASEIQWLGGTFALCIFSVAGACFWRRRRGMRVTQPTAPPEPELHADSALAKSERQYHTLFDNAAVPLLEEDFSQVKTYFGQLAASGVRDFRSYFSAHPDEVKKCAAMIKVVAVNRQGMAFFGVRNKEELKHHLPKSFLADSWPGFAVELSALAEGQLEFSYEVPARNGRGERRELLLKLSVVGEANDTLDRVLISFIDITERKQAEARVNFLAYHDRLTGLPNRVLFFDRLSQAMSLARRRKKHVALLFVDLDGFKPINDTFGHESGDAVLNMVAQRLLACVRASDCVARLGGDEFAIIAGEIEHPTEIEKVAEKILKAFAQTMALPNGQECSVGASIGISQFPDNGNEMDTLLAAADAAMYESKYKGKNRYTYFGGDRGAVNSADVWLVFDNALHVGVTEIDEQHRELVRMVNRLNGAIKNKEGDARVQQLFGELLEFTDFHFAAEHRMMEQYGFPEIAMHDAEHAGLVEEATHLKGKLTQGAEMLALQSVKDWLLHHIYSADKSLAKFLLSKGVH